VNIFRVFQKILIRHVNTGVTHLPVGMFLFMKLNFLRSSPKRTEQEKIFT